MDALESQNENIFREFRNRVKDLNRNDGTLRRFLKARNNNIQNAELMLRNSIEWRKANDVDNALSWTIPEELIQEFPYEFPGLDYQNQSIVYAPIGIWPTGKFIKAGYRAEMERQFYFGLEQVMSEITKHAEQCTFIADLAEFSYWNVADYESLQHTMKTFRVFEANYPERVSIIFIINAPYFFNISWPILKPLLTGNTLSKVNVFGSDEKKYMAALLEKIPPSSIPSALQKHLK